MINIFLISGICFFILAIVAMLIFILDKLHEIGVRAENVKNFKEKLDEIDINRINEK